MTPPRKLLTASDLDRMTPDERSVAVESRIVRDLNELSLEFRERVVQTGRRLAKERNPDDSLD